MTGPRRRPALARAFLLCALAAPASADGVGTLCDRWGHPSGRCACAAEALAAELPRDDFALYLRQARSIFDGDTAAVIADNRFSVINSDSGFSPLAYPWGWPLLLSPFVHLWGFDYDRLKLVEVAAFCLWLVLLHGIVRRRLGAIVAFAVTAVFATAPEFLEHTDQLLSEFPHLAAIAAVIWWYDRLRTRGSLLTASIGQLAVLGGLVTVAFNIRRESIVLLGVIGVMQLIDLWRENHDHAPAALVANVRRETRALLTPHLTFAAAAVAFQLVLPTDLLPDNGNASRFIDDRWGEFPGILTDQLGLGIHPVIGVAILVLAAVGAVIGVRRRPDLDTPLLVLGLLTAVVIGTHIRQVDRYWFQVTPWVVYFATVAVLAAARRLLMRSDAMVPPARHGRRRIAAATVASVPLLALVVAHLVVLPGRAADVDDYNSAGRVQIGPAHPDIAPVFDAVVELTPPDAVIGYFRARTMTLLTDRRAIQTYSAERIAADTDYFVQRKRSTYWQPEFDRSAARELGFEDVWSNERFVIWSTGR